MSTQSLQQPEQDVSNLIDELTTAIIQSNNEQKAWKQQGDDCKAQLLLLHKKGLVPTKFTRHGYTFSLSPGRAGAEMTDAAKAKMAELKAQLVADGLCVETIGDPFWNTQEKKEPKGKRNALAAIEPENL